MANENHLTVLESGIEIWNKWREEHPEIVYPDLQNARLSGKDFRNGNFVNARFWKANLSAVDFRGAIIKDVDFMDADLADAKFTGAVLDGPIFHSCDLSMANFDNTVIENGTFTDAGMECTSLVGATLNNPLFIYARLRKAEMQGITLLNANFYGAFLENANLEGAIMKGANLSLSTLVDINFANANFSNSKIYGVSAWNLNLSNATQNDLIVSKENESLITVSDIEVAQFIHLMINNKNITKILSTICNKGVLILGRFTKERKEVLDEIRSELRRFDYLPILFDFDKPPEKTFTKTIVTLAGMCLFVIADITNPSSSPLELQATVPVFKIPFVPIIQKGQSPFSMFQSLASDNRERIIGILEYSSVDVLKKIFKKAIIDPAIKLSNELRFQEPRKKRDESDFF